jgi:hypothetical protein
MFDRFYDLFEYSFRIFEDIVVPETQNAKTAISQVGVTSLIVCTIGMLTAVRFNNEHVFK